MQRLEIGAEPSSKGSLDLFADKRFYKRFRKDNRVKLFEDGKSDEAVLLDISMMGASIWSEKEWGQGAKLTLMSPMFTCEIKGEIIRRTEFENGFRYAIVFHDLNDSTVLEILNKIAYCS